MAARALALLSVFYAVWALAILPGDFFSIRDNLRNRHTFYENIAFVPILAAVGALLLLTIPKVAGDGVDANSWRGFLLVRAQLLIAALVALGQLWFESRAVCPSCRPFPAHLYALAILIVIAAPAALRLARGRKAAATLASTDSPAL